MDAALWRRVGELFDAALDRPPDRRRGFVVERAGDDEALRDEVLRLLDADERGTDVVDRPLCHLASVPSVAGEQIGAYRLIDVLGEGGMGIVYLATRDEATFERRVALKVMRDDLVGTAAIRQRFVAERQVLAELDHQHIARLFDGGTTVDGRPYLVLEWVDGEPITEACDRRCLGVDERLRLWLDVASAVEHAHDRGVIHRDIKPSNVLVTAEGKAKLLDFGIAKPLAGPSARWPARTVTGQRLLTPIYASPEQIRGEACSIATDVYSLGVLLYEMLTGRSPYRRRLLLAHEIERVVCEQEPRRPSRSVGYPAEDGESAERIARRLGCRPEALRRRLVGDLDAILMQALAKEPGRRFGSVVQMAEDVRRHLGGKPVRARGVVRGDRLRRAWRRHGRAMAATVAIGVVTIGFATELGRRGEEVVRERQQRRAMAETLTELIEVPDGASTGPGQVVELVLPRLPAVVTDDEPTRAALLGALGRVVHQAGDSRRAEALLDESLALRLGVADASAAEIAESQHDLGAVQVTRGRLDDGRSRLESALDSRRALFGDSDVRVSESQEALGLAFWAAGEHAAAEAALWTSLETRERACRAPSYWAAEALGHLAALHVESGRIDEAASLAAQADAHRALEGSSRAHRAEALEAQAMVRFARADYRGAEQRVREAIALRRADVRAVDTIDAERRLAITLQRLARILGERGAYEASKATFVEALVIERRLAGEVTPASATLLNNFAIVLGRDGEHLAAESLLRRVLSLRQRLLGDDHPHVAQTRYSLGWLLHDRGDFDAAIVLYREAAAGVGRLPSSHPARAFPAVAIARWWLDRGRPAEAEQQLTEALDHLRAHLVAGHWRIAEAEGLLAMSWLRRGRAAKAEGPLRRAAAILEAQRGERSPRVQRARGWLAELDRSEHPTPSWLARLVE